MAVTLPSATVVDHFPIALGVLTAKIPFGRVMIRVALDVWCHGEHIAFEYKWSLRLEIYIAWCPISRTCSPICVLVAIHKLGVTKRAVVREDVARGIDIGGSVVVNQCVVIADGVRHYRVVLHQPGCAQGVFQVIIAHAAHCIALFSADGVIIIAVDHAEALATAAAECIVVAVRSCEVHARSRLHEAIEDVGITCAVLPAHHAAELRGGATDKSTIEKTVVQH